MMSEQPGAAVARVSLEPVISRYSAEYGKVLPAHIGPERFERWAISCLRAALQGKQAEAWQRVLDSPAGQLSVMHALMDCASLGLEPGRTYHLVPFGTEATGIVDYKGEVELICRADPAAIVVAQLVHGKDEFHLRGANYPPLHEFDPYAEDRGPVVGGYGFVTWRGSQECSMVIHMSEAGFLRHRDKARSKNVWDEWPEAMRLKTIVHQLRKWVAWSPEHRPGFSDLFAGSGTGD